LSTQRNETVEGHRTPRGSSVPITYDMPMTGVIQGHWDVLRGSADALRFYHGPLGTTLTKLFDGSGAFFDTNAILAYLKRGWYRGGPNTNSGNLAIQIADYEFSKVAGAFTGRVTVQRPWPTHS
jgi:hypothetical protein